MTEIVLAICSVLIPAIMLTIGLLWRKKPPKDVNGAIGYRTRRAMQNQETWDFAQRYLAKLWVPTGALTLAVSAAVVLAMLHRDEHARTVACEVLSYAQLAVVVATIPVTEHALQKEFDENGRKR